MCDGDGRWRVWVSAPTPLPLLEIVEYADMFGLQGFQDDQCVDCLTLKRFQRFKQQTTTITMIHRDVRQIYFI